jgi:hypothetical protein
VKLLTRSPPIQISLSPMHLHSLVHKALTRIFQWQNSQSFLQGFYLAMYLVGWVTGIAVMFAVGVWINNPIPTPPAEKAIGSTPMPLR